jgi:hypothetical protein
MAQLGPLRQLIRHAQWGCLPPSPIPPTEKTKKSSMFANAVAGKADGRNGAALIPKNRRAFHSSCEPLGQSIRRVRWRCWLLIGCARCRMQASRTNSQHASAV